MAVRIIIDRKVKKGKESDFAKLLRELRLKAVPSKGYISGETLRALDDPHNYIVITTWKSIDDWKKWEKSPEIKVKKDYKFHGIKVLQKKIIVLLNMQIYLKL